MDHKKNIALSSDETLRHQSHEADCLPVTRLTHPGRERRGRGSSEIWVFSKKPHKDYIHLGVPENTGYPGHEGNWWEEKQTVAKKILDQSNA